MARTRLIITYEDMFDIDCVIHDFKSPNPKVKFGVIDIDWCKLTSLKDRRQWCFDFFDSNVTPNELCEFDNSVPIEICRYLVSEKSQEIEIFAISELSGLIDAEHDEAEDNRLEMLYGNE